jgi:transglutaminase-like putative cysteine protease
MSEIAVEPVTDNSPGGYLHPTPRIQSDDPTVVAFAKANAGHGDEIAQAISLYYAVRDGVRYDPYSMQLVPEELGAVRCLAQKVGFCIPKAALLAASARALGIPARVGYADVKNHLATGKLIEMMGTDLFIWHGYTDLFLDGKWVKATPAFNIELCDKFKVLPLEFDGREDSLFHPFDANDQPHMEYVSYHGAFRDVPVEPIIHAFSTTYWRMFDGTKCIRPGDFHSEAEAEH